MSGTLKREIKQKRPFRSLQEEVVLSVMRTADLLVMPLNDVLRAAGLSTSQYNILRILRGAGEEGLPCGEISERMVRRDPDLTRLLDRLEARGLVTRARGTADRRVVITTVTAAAIQLLDELDAPVDDTLERSLGKVPKKDLQSLLSLLDEVRAAVTEHVASA